MMRLINLTLPVVLEEIDAALDTELYRSQPDLMSLPNLKQRLVEYTLSRIPSRYRAIESTDKPEVAFRSLPSSLEEHLRVAAIVRQGIHQLIYELEQAIATEAMPADACLLVLR